MKLNDEFLKSFNSKSELFLNLRKQILNADFSIKNEDSSRPWGGFFVLDENNAQSFLAKFFPELVLDDAQLSLKLSPKILIVEPQKRLSWQYHNRRAEVWKLIGGDGEIVRSEDDNIKEAKNLILGELIKLKQGERHRLIGGNSWTIVAEIWIHTDPDFPSDEEDIIRVEDDFARL
jgi:mannose-6-phosphate isomerase-like protein (cupin superfamily)